MKSKTSGSIQKAFKELQRDNVKITLAIVFVVAAAGLALMCSHTPIHLPLLALSAVVGGYMAMNIGANDVANNVGPLVGSQAITLGMAILMAALCEVLGAVLAGSEVVQSIKGKIIDPEHIQNTTVFVGMMFSALLSGAIWLHLATAIGAPVSTTHSIVGGVLGAGLVAGGAGAVDWQFLGGIVASWVISPVMGGGIAMGLMVLFKQSISDREDKRNAALRAMPLVVGAMGLAFTWYMLAKVLRFSLGGLNGALLSVGVGLLAYSTFSGYVASKINSLENTKESVHTLFTLPLVFSAALLSFAHGANDVANAVGPLAAIVQSLQEWGHHAIPTKAYAPLWIMLIGGLGIATGLSLYGPRLIKTVGSEITELDKMQAFCIAMATVITVLLASKLGLPVSSTHITIGAVFGVGFLREFLQKRLFEMKQMILDAHHGEDASVIKNFLDRFEKANPKQKKEMLAYLKTLQKENNTLEYTVGLSKKERKGLKKAYKSELLKRSVIKKIITAWLITVPISALLGALGYYLIDTFNIVKRL
ncbi:Probable low-affinity inorganic phosphate transporter [Helicobacter heilmannii]|uniref:inorganic phosphate transporter n=5 Tax=Helicobacter heilmannii TaxID=35817 RepID=UPI0006A2248E|nr:inorganic phosphate transporter [Helicobacter heilmannii]CRF49494.1 Probable low-affinity inorganic phosphate transporter [Helicobacter heilmannii]